MFTLKIDNMKKIKNFIILVFVVFLLVGCKDNNIPNENETQPVNQDNTVKNETVNKLEDEPIDTESAEKDLREIGKELYAKKTYENYDKKDEAYFISFRELIKLGYKINYNCDLDKSGISFYHELVDNYDENLGPAPVFIDCK